MKLCDYLTQDRVAILAGTTKAEALAELAAVLEATGVGLGKDKLTEAIAQREALMSTGIGNGLAVPHARLADLAAAAVAVGISPEGIADYESLDGQPVRIIVLIIAPEGEHQTYIRLLALVTTALKDADRRAAIQQARGAEPAYALLMEPEA